jgi:replicative DNA helicase
LLDNHYIPEENMLLSHHKWIDERLGGLGIGTLNIYCGFANIGKSLMLCNDVANHVRAGQDCVYITLEMSAEEVLQRIGANVMEISTSTYNRVDKKPMMRQKFTDFYEYNFKQPGECFVKQFPSSTATVATIKAYLLKIKSVRGFIPKMVFIDYLGLMAAASKFDNEYNKLKNIATDLRSLGVELGICIVTAAQLNRGANTASDFEMDALSDSIELARIADNLFGIIQTPEDYKDNLYWLKILKVRRALLKCKGSRASYNVEYSQMRVIETGEVFDL